MTKCQRPKNILFTMFFHIRKHWADSSHIGKFKFHIIQKRRWKYEKSFPWTQHRFACWLHEHFLKDKPAHPKNNTLFAIHMQRNQADSHKRQTRHFWNISVAHKKIERTNGDDAHCKVKLTMQVYFALRLLNRNATRFSFGIQVIFHSRMSRKSVKRIFAIKLRPNWGIM